MKRLVPNMKDFHKYCSIRNAVLIYCRIFKFCGDLDSCRNYTDFLFGELMKNGKAVIPADQNSSGTDIVFNY